MQTQPQQSSVLAWHFLKEGSVMRDGKVAPADGSPSMHIRKQEVQAA